MSTRRKLYRSRDGLLLGVCRGIAEWREFPVELVRLGFILLVFFAGMSIWVYFILALIFPLEPRKNRMTDEEYDDLKREYRKMADDINKERDWESRFGKGK